MNPRAINGTPFADLPAGWTVGIADSPSGARWYYPIRIAAPVARTFYRSHAQAAARAREIEHEEALTCGCGLYIHPRRRNPAAIHIPDCAEAA